jgi:hypothetical protein
MMFGVKRSFLGYFATFWLFRTLVFKKPRKITQSRHKTSGIFNFFLTKFYSGKVGKTKATHLYIMVDGF